MSMSSSQKKKAGDKWKKTRHDKWYKLAKEQGYRSRAAFKLIQINKKYNFLGNCKAVIDLCASPGGWLQVCAKQMPVSSLIIGVDLLPIKPIRGVVTHVADITTQHCRSLLRKECQGWQVDAVLHDGAPNVAGGSTWATDAYAQIELVLQSLKLATEFLRKGGYFITKIFRSQDYNSLLWLLQQFFEKVEVFKPQASRAASAEIFAVCMGYLAPRKIDPRLFEPGQVFKNVEQPKKQPDVLHTKMTTKQRQREGYDDAATEKGILYKEASVVEFIEGADPLAVLGSYNALVFDKDAEAYQQHTATNEDIREALKDLKVLGKGDFRTLLRWRKKMRDFRAELLAQAEGEDGKKPERKELTPEEKEDLEQKKLDAALEEARAAMLARIKREKKKKKERQMRERRRMDLNIHSKGMGEDPDEDLFRLSGIKSMDELDTVHRAGGKLPKDIDDGTPSSDDDKDPMDLSSILNAVREDSDFSDDEGSRGAGPMEDEDEDEDAESAYERKLEEDLDSAWNEYKQRRKIADKKRKELGLADEEDELPAGMKVGADDEEEDAEGRDAEMLAAADGDMDEDAEEDEEGEGDGGLVVSLAKVQRPSKEARTKMWFDRLPMDVLSDPSSAAAALARKARAAAPARPAEISSDEEEEEDENDLADSEEADEDEDEDSEEEEMPPRKRARLEGAGASAAGAGPAGSAGKQKEKPGSKKKQTKKEKDEENKRKRRGKKGEETEGKLAFEEVPLEEDFSSDSDAVAERLALGTAMLRKKKREEIIDSAYNRYAFDDGDLPEWFAADEARHNKAQLPVTKAEVDAFKEQLKAINARPMKKIAEARARKKMKTLKRWEKIKAQAESIASSEGQSEGDKLRAIQKLYKGQGGKKGKEKKKERQYVVSQKGGGTRDTPRKKGAVVVRVDPRMKKDKRGMRAAAKRSKKSTKVRNKKRARSQKS